MNIFLRWLRVVVTCFLFTGMLLLAVNHRLVVYLIRQGMGQLAIVRHTMPIQMYQASATRPGEKENLLLVDAIKAYSVDSLGFTPTANYSTVYDEQGGPSLWALTASEAYALKAYEWTFPLIGKVTYKGFFDRGLALREANGLSAGGYDVDLRPVTAWSTLGWFNDPLMSNVLSRKKGAFCDLLFHELFHATYYAPNNVDLNENLANFIAHKATQLFLRGDSAALAQYDRNRADEQVLRRFLKGAAGSLQTYYQTIQNRSSRQALKQHRLLALTDSLDALPLYNETRRATVKKNILTFKNAYFIGYNQYESLQDSLEIVFNKFYRGDLKKMVHDLKRN